MIIMAFRGYKPDKAGLREVGRSSEMGSASMDAARKIASIANGEDPEGQYVAEAMDVPSGWDNDLRAGARVSQTEYSRRGVERRTLVRAANG